MNWTEQENNIIRENFNKKTLPQIMKLLPDRKCGYSGFRSHCQRLGLFRPRTGVKIPNKNTYNQEYFSEVNLMTAFLGGRIAGDGCIFIPSKSNKSKSHTFSYKVAVKDEIIIDQFIKELDFKGPKQYTQGKSPHSDNMCYLVSFSCKGFDKNAEYLNKYYNLTPNKTMRLGPTNLKEDILNFAYIAGMTDSDGTIGLSKSGGNISPYISICSSSPHIIRWYKKIMDEYFPADKYSLTKREVEVGYHNKGHYYRFALGGLRALVVINYLRQFPVPYLDRKFNNPEILTLIDTAKNKYPDLFIVPNPEELQKYLPKDNISQNSISHSQTLV